MWIQISEQIISNKNNAVGADIVAIHIVVMIFLCVPNADPVLHLKISPLYNSASDTAFYRQLYNWPKKIDCLTEARQDGTGDWELHAGLLDAAGTVCDSKGTFIGSLELRGRSQGQVEVWA